MAEASKRTFCLRDPETGEAVPGEVGLATLKLKSDAKGVLDVSKLQALDLEHLERLAATASSYVTEGEPKDVR